MSAAPISIEQLPVGWIESHREAAQRDGHALRAGWGSSIEIQSINTGEWHWMLLPSSDREFTTTAERNQVLAELQKAQT